MSFRKIFIGSLVATTFALQIASIPAHAAVGPGWGPGHGMMWGGPTRNWFGWGASEHFCGEEGQKNVSRFMALIDRAVTPTEAQKPAEEALKKAFETAQEQLAGLCDKPHSGPWSPVERLTVAESHLREMLNAIGTIRGPLETFYSGLSDDQKKKMDALRPDWRMRLNWPR